MNQPQPEIICRILPPAMRSADAVSALMVLYEPMIGVRARGVYDMLNAFCTREQCWNLEELLLMLDMKKERFVSERRHLEEFGLLQTFSDITQRYFEFRLQEPLSPQAFFQDEIFCRIYHQTVGQSRYELARKMFAVDVKSENLKNVSATLADSGLYEDWDAQKELDFIQANGPIQNLEKYPFDWVKFYEGMDVQIPNNLRTIHNRMQIARLANFYGVAEEDMKKHVLRSIRNNRSRIDFDFLQEILQKGTKKNNAQARQKEPTLDMSPLLYLQKKTGKNARLTEREINVLTRLTEQYEFGNEVINTLVDYCLKECRSQFNPRFIYSVANTWSREKIETVQQAQAYIEQDRQARSNGFIKETEQPGLPDWYADTQEDEEPDQDLIAQALAIQAQLQQQN